MDRRLDQLESGEPVARRDAEETLDALLLEGLESGEPTEMTSEDWQGLRDAVRARLETRVPKA